MKLPIKSIKVLLRTSMMFCSYSSWNTIIYDPGCIFELLSIDSEELKQYNAVVWAITILVNGEYYYSCKWRILLFQIYSRQR